jgi:hypothetical protein
MIRKTVLTSLMLAALNIAAIAHDLEKGPNGGQLIDIKGHHVEFVAKAGAIVIYLTGDKDAPIASKGAEGRAIVQANGKAETLSLTPEEPNLLTAKIGAPLSPGAKVVVTGKLSDGHEIQARFVVK